MEWNLTVLERHARDPGIYTLNFKAFLLLIYKNLANKGRDRAKTGAREKVSDGEPLHLSASH